MVRWLSAQRGGHVLGGQDLPDAAQVCAMDPVAAVLVAGRVESAARTGLARAGGELWGYRRDGELTALCWMGANLVPVVPEPDDAALDAFATMARRAGRRCSSIIGDAAAVTGLWQRLERYWPVPREIRADQPSMVIDADPAVEPDPLVRRGLPEEYDVVLPACVRMFVEEVGYSPIDGGFGSYEARVSSLLRAGRSFVRMENEPSGPRVIFKAEVGAVAGGVAQVQGVWVDPDFRGRRLSVHGMAAVVNAVRRDIAPVVSLYVNHYNHRALATYRAVGFRQVGTYATILF